MRLPNIYSFRLVVRIISLSVSAKFDKPPTMTIPAKPRLQNQEVGIWSRKTVNRLSRDIDQEVS